jgi:hypothetical protein
LKCFGKFIYLPLIQVNGGDNDDGSGNDDQTQLRKVNNGKNSTTKVIDLQSHGKFNNQEFSAKSGSVELKTEAPERAEPTTTTTIGEPEITSTLTQKSTLTREFPTVTSKTLATEISTLSAGVEQNETSTKSSRLQKIKPTEDIIRLEESDYESSGISLENYSGDDKEGSSGNSGEYGSSDRK